jgi:predicted Zn finger-like uncharacterized protein
MAVAVTCTTCGNKFQAAKHGPARCPRCCTPVTLERASTPAPQGDDWYYQVIGQEIGPVAFLDLQRLARDGRISPDTLVRRASSARWLLAERVTGVFDAVEERTEWYFTHHGKRLGPVSYPSLRKLILAGQLTAADLLWQTGWPTGVTVGRCIADNLLLLPVAEIPDLPPAEEIDLTCPHCGDRYAVDADLAGKKVLCRSCHQPIQVV